MKKKVKTGVTDTRLFEKFDKIYLVDSSGWNISNSMKDVFRGAGGGKGTSSAAVKVQLTYEYKSGEISCVELTDGVVNDSKYLKKILGLINNGKLIIQDLGYWGYEIFNEINKNRGSFLSRYHTSSDLWIEKDGQYVKLEFEKFLKTRKSNAVEIDAYIKKSNNYLKIRTIFFRVPETVSENRRRSLKGKNKKKGGREKNYTPKAKNLYLCEWSVFVTNTDEEQIPSNMIRSVYRLRWNIELIFKSWKSIMKIHKSNVRKNEHRFRVELFAKLIFAVLIHKIYHAIAPELWLNKKAELSIWCISDFFIRRAELLRNAICVSPENFSNLIKQLVPIILRTCCKGRQKSRKTTLQLIDEFIGDAIPIKIDSENILNLMMISD